MNVNAINRYLDKLFQERAELKKRILEVESRIESCKIIIDGLYNPDLSKFADALYDVACDVAEKKEL